MARRSQRLQEEEQFLKAILGDAYGCLQRQSTVNIKKRHT